MRWPVNGNHRKNEIFILPVLWSFRYYAHGDRKTGIRHCHDEGSKKLQGTFRSRLTTLAGLDWDEWREPYIKALSGSARGLHELRFKADGVQQRPLGFVSGIREFTFLLWATEKGGRFVPLSAPETALRIKDEVRGDRSLTNAVWFALE
jgi:hypothetical protein